MSETTKPIRRPTVTLHLPKSAAALILYSISIVQRLTGNASLPNPSPTIEALTAGIEDLKAAQTAAIGRTKGAVAARNAKRTALVGLLQHLRAYIQSVADADPANAASIIESAGIGVRKTTTRAARVFAAKPGAVSGVAKVVAKQAARRASYEWQYSTDGGKTWVTAPATLQAKTSVTGLTPGATVQFKYRAVTKTGPGDWSEAISMMAH